MKATLVTLVLFCSSIGITSVYAQSRTQQRLILYYPFEGNALDAGPNGIDGNLFGPTFIPDRFGKPQAALEFNGAGDYLIADSSLILDKLVPPYTIASWVRIDSWAKGRWAPVMSKSDVNDLQDRVIFRVDSTLWMAPYPACDEYFHGGLPQSGTWFHFAVAKDIHSVLLYINGNLIQTFLCTTPPDFNSVPLQLGQDQHAFMEYFSGALDDFSIYDTVLNEAQVQSIYNWEGGVSIDQDMLREEIVVWPNPAPGQWNVSYPNGWDPTIRLYDNQGRMIHAELTSGPESTQIVTTYRGLVFMVLTTRQGVMSKVLIVE